MGQAADGLFGLSGSAAIAAAGGVALGALVTFVLLTVRAVFRRRGEARALAARMRPTLKGRIAEQLAPHLGDEFVWSAADARFLGHPIDYVVFDGYAEGGEVTVVLVEVKTGNARLSDGQRRVRAAVDEGRVRFASVRL